MIPVGPFLLDDAPFARGGMGVVWTGRHRDGAAVAVKVLSPRDDVDLAGLLEAEIRAAASLDHPNVVAVWDRGLVDAAAAAASKGALARGSLWYAMEFVAGGVLSWKRPWTWTAARSATLDLLAALAHAHARGVLHRDIKPANLLFTAPSAGAPSRLKLADFGMGWRFAAGSGGATRIGGTPQYMAPEQFTGDLALQGPWTDLYAVGCLLYALLCGRPPHRGTFDELRVLHREAPFPPLEPRCAVPPGVEELLARLVARRCGDRFARAADAVAALRALPEGDTHPSRGLGGPPAPTLRSAEAASASTEFPTLVALPPEPSPEPQGGQTRPPPAPPPADWRTAAGDARPPSGVGLALFGMRPVPMVGRDAERDALWGWLLQVRRARSPGLAVLRGPRGEGKTRLAEWLAETADETGAAVVLRAAFGTGAERDGVAGLVADHYHLPPARGPDTAWAWLVRAGAVDGTDPDEARRLAYVVTAAAEPRGPARASPDDRAAVIGRLARRVAGARAVVVVLDDLDQDPDALGLAARLLAQPDLPALIVATVSDGAALGPLTEAALDRTLDLGPLPPADGVALVRGLLPVSPQIARRVEEQSGGHPLVAVQLVSHWVERGWVRSGDGGFDVVRGASGPRALARLWGERIVAWSGRDPRTEDTLLAAAVLGRVVDRGEWAAVARELELPDPEPLVPRLAELGLGQPAGARPHPFVFAHGLLRDIVLERAGVVRCGVVHRAAARALGATGAGVERRGSHLLAGGDLVGAWPLLVTAAQIRLRCGEPEGALAALARLEAAAGPLPDGDARRAELDAERAQVHRLSGRFVEAAALAERAAAVPGVAPNVRIKALRELSVLLQYTSRDPRVQPLLDEAFAVAEVAGLHDQLPALWIQRGRALEYGGRLAEAREAYLAGRRLALAGTPAGSDGDDAELGEVLVGLASVAHKLGDLAEATIAAQDALTRFRARHLTWHEIWAETLLGELHRASGDLSGAEAAYRGAIARYDALSAGQSALPRANLALVLLARGAWVDALGEASRARDDARAAGHENLARMVSLFVAWAAAGVGRWDLVEDGLATAADLVERGLCDPDLRHAADQAAATCAAGGRPDLAAAARAIAEAQARALSPAPVPQGQG